MQIAELRIENFRGVQSGHVRFDQHSVLVGPNNCGKTTIIEALALLFGRDRMVRTLTEHDFFGGDPQPTDRIRLVARSTRRPGSPTCFAGSTIIPPRGSTSCCPGIGRSGGPLVLLESLARGRAVQHSRHHRPRLAVDQLVAFNR
jgi:energy-coupling factor transporter ATP-binding protein EcfA2